jgi:hypothetical protein
VKEDDRLTLYQVTALEPLLARIYVPEWALFGLKQGQPSRVIPQEGPHAGGQEAGRGGIAARIRWINDVVDAASATAEVLVEVLPGAAASDLRPGMSVRVALDLELAGDGAVSRPSRGAPPDASAVVSLPREAVGAWPGSDPAPGQEVSLRILAQDGTIETRPVVLGFIGDRRVQVRRGLRPGEKVVLPQ